MRCVGERRDGGKSQVCGQVPTPHREVYLRARDRCDAPHGSGPRRGRVSCSLSAATPASSVSLVLSSLLGVLFTSTRVLSTCRTQRLSQSKTYPQRTQSECPLDLPTTPIASGIPRVFAISDGSSSRNARTRIPLERRHVRHHFPGFPMSEWRSLAALGVCGTTDAVLRRSRW